MSDIPTKEDLEKLTEGLVNDPGSFDKIDVIVHLLQWCLALLFEIERMKKQYHCLSCNEAKTQEEMCDGITCMKCNS